MRTIFYTFPIFFLAVSCNRNIEQKELIGSWKRIDVVCKNCQNYSQKTIFTQDSLVFQEFENEKLVTRISAKYKFDEISKTISYDAGNVKGQLKVLKLNNLEMELLNTHQKKAMRFKHEE